MEQSHGWNNHLTTSLDSPSTISWWKIIIFWYLICKLKNLNLNFKDGPIDENSFVLPAFFIFYTFFFSINLDECPLPYYNKTLWGSIIPVIPFIPPRSNNSTESILKKHTCQLTRKGSQEIYPDLPRYLHHLLVVNWSSPYTINSLHFQAWTVMYLTHRIHL